jgi:hypothetical protein
MTSDDMNAIRAICNDALFRGETLTARDAEKIFELVAEDLGRLDEAERDPANWAAPHYHDVADAAETAIGHATEIIRNCLYIIEGMREPDSYPFIMVMDENVDLLKAMGALMNERLYDYDWYELQLEDYGDEESERERLARMRQSIAFLKRFGELVKDASPGDAKAAE